MDEINESNEYDIPDWLYKSVRSKLKAPELLKKTGITVILNPDPFSPSPLIIAYTNAQRFDGIFIIYQKCGKSYKEAFVKRLDEVMSVNICRGDIILESQEQSGTGVFTSYYYVIRRTPGGFKEIWKGLAQDYKVISLNPYNEETFGGISFSYDGDIIHSVFMRLFQGDNPDNAFQSLKYTDIYKYDESSSYYRFFKRY